MSRGAGDRLQRARAPSSRLRRAPIWRLPDRWLPADLRVTALGGISEIGRNMTVFEHLGRLLIIDCGVLFPDHDEPGVDLILPDLRHIESRLDDIEALVLTHAHEDHIGAIPHLLKLRARHPGRRIPSSRWRWWPRSAGSTASNPSSPSSPKGRRSTHGVFECQYFAVNHSITGCAGDRRAHRRRDGPAHRRHQARPVAARRSVPPTCRGCRGSATPAWICSCAIRPTPSIPGVEPVQSEVGPTLHRLIRGADGRVIVACFASNVDRVQQIIDAAVALGRARCPSSDARWSATWASPVNSAS